MLDFYIESDSKRRQLRPGKFRPPDKLIASLRS